MGLITRYLRVPRPTTFLYVMNLRTGVEMISLAMVFNKLAGFYGLLAILTGMRLSTMQLSMYIYSLIALVLVALLAPHIRKQSPFQCLTLAWLYLIDTFVNTIFTAGFAVTWFLAVSADHVNKSILSGAPGSGTIEDIAGFTSPKHNVSQVDVIATPAAGATAGQDAAAFAAAGVAAASSAGPSLGHAVQIEESVPSLIVVVILTLIRVYFILIVMAYARQVLRQYMYSKSTKVLHIQTEGSADVQADNPFEIGSPAGEGWKGKLGRLMVKVGESYWLGGEADDSWAKGLDTRFRNSKAPSGPRGTFERERRARSGTGPPIPMFNLGKV